MKVLKYILVLAITIASTSCNDFLEQPQGSTVTIDSVFFYPDNAMKVLNNVYGTCVVNGFMSGGTADRNDNACYDGMLYAACDEGDRTGDGVPNQFNKGLWGPTYEANSQNEYSMAKAFTGIRNANVYLENVDKVQNITTGKYIWTNELKLRTIAEAKMLRAMMYFELFKRYGGVPIITSVPKVSILEVDGNSKAVVLPEAKRNSLKSTIDFIVSSCDEAINDLPNPAEYSSADAGRMHKGVAIALKARTLLYAASPLFNTDTPYLSYANKDLDSLICYGNYDPNRWVVAVEANRDMLAWASANGFKLLDESAGIVTSNPPEDKANDPTLYYANKRESYNIVTCLSLDPRNTEVIYYDHSHGTDPGLNNTVRWTVPILSAWGNCAHAMPFGFVKNYRKTDGTDLSIPNEGTYLELKSILKKSEPRFRSTAWTPGTKFSTNALYKSTNLPEDTARFLYKLNSGVFGQTAGNGFMTYGIPNGFYIRKFTNLLNYAGGKCDSYWPIFRLSEFYLNYAEALNEANPNDMEIVNALNVIRNRGGLPLLAEGNATYDECFGNKEKMRQYIIRERAVELYGEEHRFFDVRRWKIAGNDGVMRGDFYKIYLYENGTGTYLNPTTSMTPAARIANDLKLSYKVEFFENRVWEDKMYLYPFFQTEINKGILVQNPGW